MGNDYLQVKSDMPRKVDLKASNMDCNVEPHMFNTFQHMWGSSFLIDLLATHSQITMPGIGKKPCVFFGGG